MSEPDSPRRTHHPSAMAPLVHEASPVEQTRKMAPLLRRSSARAVAIKVSPLRPAPDDDSEIGLGHSCSIRSRPKPSFPRKRESRDANSVARPEPPLPRG